jgi:hypothetical protein
MGISLITFFINCYTEYPWRVNILGGHSVGRSKQKKLYIYIYPIPNSFQDTAI